MSLDVGWHLVFRYVENLDRVRNLIRLYDSHPSNVGKGRRSVGASDILRAATVLLHATFEDMCRTVERHLLPHGPPENLSTVPLIGTESTRAEKFLLGDLARHRGKTVDEVVQFSLEAHLAKKSYSSIEDLCALLKRLSFPMDRFRPHFANLAELCLRRHHIVHQADRNEARGSGQHQARSIGRTALLKWISAIEGIYFAFQHNIAATARKYKRI